MKYQNVAEMAARLVEVADIVDFQDVEELDVRFALGTRSKAGKGHWENQPPISWEAMGEFLKAREVGKKDGPCFLQGLCADKNRSAKSMIANYVLGVDIDTGQSAEELDAIVEAEGLACVRYPTHSFGATETDIPRDKFFDWLPAGEELTAETAARFLIQERNYVPGVVEGLEIVRESEYTADGINIRVQHAPRPKWRLVFPLARPFEFGMRGQSQKEDIQEWKELVAGFCTTMGFHFDKACVDPARLFYLQRYPKGATPPESRVYPGKALDLEAYDRVSIRGGRSKSVADNPFTRAAGDVGEEDRFIFEGTDLKRLVAKRHGMFDIQEAYDDEFKRDPRSSGPGVHVECPFEDEHSKSGGSGTFIVNGGDNSHGEGFRFKCMHDACAGRDRLDLLKGALERGHIEPEALEDDNFWPEVVAEGEADPNSGDDFAYLDPTTWSLEDLEPYFTVECAKRAIAALDANDTNEAKRIASQVFISMFSDKKAKLKLIKACAKKVGLRELDINISIPCALRQYPLSVIRSLLNMNRRYAHMIVGNTAVILDQRNPHEPKVLKKETFKSHTQNQLVKIKDGEKEKEVPLYTFWFKWTGRRTYEGFEFEPDPERQTPDYFNDWSGFDMQPEASGSWGLLQEHLYKNVCHDNEEHYNWLITWFAQIIQQPGKKLGSAFVLIGDKGAGKSIVFEHFSELLGRYSLGISQKDHLLGRFNSHQRGKLLIYAEEGFWAGDKQGEGALKNLITRDRINIEQKGIDMVEMSNYSRIGVISNEDWVVPASLEGERRFFVLKVSNDRQQDIDFFAAMKAQLDDGGYAAMFHDLLKWEPPFKEGWNVLRKPPKTNWLRDQALMSQDPERAFFTEAVADGCFVGFGDNPSLELNESEPTVVQKKDLKEYFRDFLSWHGGSTRHRYKDSLFQKLVLEIFGIKEHKLTVDGKRVVCFEIPPLSELRNRLNIPDPGE